MALILTALWSLFKKSRKDIFTYLLMAASGVAVLFFNVNAIIVISVCAVIGIAALRVGGKRE